MSQLAPTQADSLHSKLCALTASGCQLLASAIIFELTSLCWSVGHRLAAEVLGGERAHCGGQVMASLSQQLAKEFGCGFETKNMHYMVHVCPGISARTRAEEITV